MRVRSKLHDRRLCSGALFVGAWLTVDVSQARVALNEAACPIGLGQGTSRQSGGNLRRLNAPPGRHASRVGEESRFGGISCATIRDA